MRLYEILLVGLFSSSPVLAQDDDPPPPVPTGIDVFANVTLYQPDSANTAVTAPRTASLPNNTVLAAWNDPSTAGSIAIYRSTNSGYSWYQFGTATSDSGKKLLQPNLLYINGTYGGDTGIVLLAAVATDDYTTAIELYTSGDSGESWDLVSEIATGGPPSNVTTAVANPYLFHKYVSSTLTLPQEPNPYLAAVNKSPSSTPAKATRRTRRRSCARPRPTTTTVGTRQST